MPARSVDRVVEVVVIADGPSDASNHVWVMRNVFGFRVQDVIIALVEGRSAPGPAAPPHSRASAPHAGWKGRPPC